MKSSLQIYSCFITNLQKICTDIADTSNIQCIYKYTSNNQVISTKFVRVIPFIDKLQSFFPKPKPVTV